MLLLLCVNTLLFHYDVTYRRTAPLFHFLRLSVGVVWEGSSCEALGTCPVSARPVLSACAGFSPHKTFPTINRAVGVYSSPVWSCSISSFSVTTS